jgi:hypothetical protein
MNGNGGQIWRFYKIAFLPQVHSLFTKLFLLADENELSVQVWKKY